MGVFTAISIIAVVAAASLSAYSAHQQAQSQKKSAEYNKKVAENNAKLSTMQAQFNAQRLREKNRRLAAKQRTGFAKSGVSIVSGSAFDVLADQESQGELDVLTTLYRGKVQAVGYQGQAKYQDFVGESAQTQGTINVASSLVSGAAGVAGTINQAQSVNATNRLADSIQKTETTPEIEGF